MKPESLGLGNEQLLNEIFGFFRNLWLVRDLEGEFANRFSVIFCLLRGLERKDAEEHLHEQNSKAPAVCSEVVFLTFDHLIGVVAWSSSTALELSILSHYHCQAKVA